MTLNHVGIIPDGNRRWAKQNGLKPWEGHRAGANRVRELINASIKLGIKNITLYTFSTENFKREKIEFEFLMKLFKEQFKQEMDSLDFEKNNIKVRFAGDKTLFSADIADMMQKMEEKTKNNTNLTVNFAMGYGGRAEIVHAVNNIIKDNVASIDERSFSDYLYVPEDVDLIIRTSGEKRTSNFLPWQSAYAEWIFVDKYFPDFTDDDFKGAISEFNLRQRRFGGQ